ncbi:tail fiber domain-containing protein [uncultured Bradyrhizobium sp.]|uniref:tail fiber domain-containing protein n=1 Tax=uncultured Bradyrhizobium sp. TaxID=199684 RepID=UPI0035CBBA96
MGGKSTTEQTQQSTTKPWEAATPALEGILGQLQTGLGKTGVTGAESGALDTLTNNANTSSATFAPGIMDYAKTLLAGGGANGQAGNIQGGFDAFKAQMSPFADPNYSSMDSPALQRALQQASTDATNSINAGFAAGGRDFSGANQMALGRGIAAAQAPLILNQFNQDRATQQGAANSLFSGQNTTGGLLSGLNQTALSNQGQGVTAAGQATDAANAGANATLQAEAQRRGIPAESLALLAKIGVPIAALGSQSTGKSQGEQQMSGADQFQRIMSGIGSLGNLWGGGKSGGK